MLVEAALDEIMTNNGKPRSRVYHIAKSLKNAGFSHFEVIRNHTPSTPVQLVRLVNKVGYS